MAGIIVGAVLTFAPLWGVFETAWGFLQTIFMARAGALTEPNTTAHDITVSIVTVAAGLVLFPVGVGLLLVCIPAFKKLKQPRVESHG